MNRSTALHPHPCGAPVATPIGRPIASFSHLVHAKTMKIESPQSWIVRTELEKAAYDNGWRIPHEENDGWLIRESATAPGEVALAGCGQSGPWALSINHRGVAAELGQPHEGLTGPGIASYVVATIGELHALLSRVYDLSIALPDDPLRRFEDRTSSLPKTTEAERLVVQRVGQNIFRDSLMRFWNKRCPLTGIAEPDLVRASHMKPWAKCKSDAERLDVFNGLLLSALWDATFDAGLVSFTDVGEPLWSPALSEASRDHLERTMTGVLQLSPGHLPYLAFHRDQEFKA